MALNSSQFEFSLSFLSSSFFCRKMFQFIFHVTKSLIIIDKKTFIQWTKDTFSEGKKRKKNKTIVCP